ncbi:hypothetical protein HDV05_003141 [Chytridiales sp. JEL 0842]|nr:hypothetical protein HDV05_003141 [Chytridiales sp. JEL 0842]
MQYLQDSLYILDSCNKRILKLDSTNGALVGELSWNFEGFIRSVSPTEDNESLMVIGSPKNQQSAVLFVDPKTMEETGRLELEGGAVDGNGLLMKDGKIFVSSEKKVLAFDAKTGKVLAEWNGSGGKSGPPNTEGHFGLAADIDVLLDGNIAVNGVGSAAMQKFNITLLP